MFFYFNFGFNLYLGAKSSIYELLFQLTARGSIMCRNVNDWKVFLFLQI